MAATWGTVPGYSWLHGLRRRTIGLVSFVAGVSVGALLVTAHGAWDTSKVPEWITAIGTVVLAIVTLALAMVGISQIRVVARQQRKWTTLQACDRYDSDPIINAAHDVLWKHINVGAQSSVELTHAALRLLNYFDAIAIGIDQGLYIDELAHDHIGNIVRLRLEELRSLNVKEVNELLNGLHKHHAALAAMSARWVAEKGGQKFRDD